ncbi:MAG: hypothetical protein LBL58_10090 [Tannerellaceae bacterium]|jgi:hypothetical protein|nr:hypothetical protein [Tannerellaceae bacterium]
MNTKSVFVNLYADSYVDLVIIDVSDMNNIRVTGRVNDILPYTLPVAENDQLHYAEIEKDKGVVVGWQVKREKHKLETGSYPYYVCDGEDGLKIFDATDYTTITDNPLAHFPDIQTYDVIPVNGYLFMIGDDGFYLYDYSDIKNIRQIGHIPVAKS